MQAGDAVKLKENVYKVPVGTAGVIDCMNNTAARVVTDNSMHGTFWYSFDEFEVVTATAPVVPVQHNNPNAEQKEHQSDTPNILNIMNF